MSDSAGDVASDGAGGGDHERFQVLFPSPELDTLVDPRINPAYERTLGYPLRELLSRPVLESSTRKTFPRRATCSASASAAIAMT